MHQETRWESNDQLKLWVQLGVKDPVDKVLVDTKGFDIDNTASRFGLRKGYWMHHE